LKGMDLPQRHGENREKQVGSQDFDPTPPRVLHGCEKKGVAEKGIRKSMKTKGHLGRQGRTNELPNAGKSDWWEQRWGHPRGNADQRENKGIAGKAIRKSMKTKGRQIRVTQRHRSPPTGRAGTEKIRGQERLERDHWRRRKKRDPADHGER
jgi:hypothetical protein